MTENAFNQDLESEIAELSRQIENKKRALEVEKGIVREEKEILAETVVEHFYPNQDLNISASNTTDENLAVATTVTKLNPVNKDYLDTLPAEVVESINTYVSMIPKDGIRKTINKVQSEQPFMVDAFHDALVTRLYEELKERGIIK